MTKFCILPEGCFVVCFNRILDVVIIQSDHVSCREIPHSFLWIVHFSHDVGAYTLSFFIQCFEVSILVIVYLLTFPQQVTMYMLLCL